MSASRLMSWFVPFATTVALATFAGCGLFGGGDDGGGGDGIEEIQDAGEFELEEEYDQALSDPVTTTETPELGAQGHTYVCTTTNWGTSEIRELTERTALSQDESIYPGALLQGAGFETGFFTPITIARAGGTIYMTGLALAPDSEYSRDLDEISASDVQNAIADIILDNDVQGTAAEASFSVVQTYSSDHMFFSLGVDARYGVGSISADLSMDQTSSKNYTLMKFTQKYYDIVFEDPELSTSVFQDRNSFSDPEDQIGPGNPPLYVSRVSYGRQVFFVAESEYTASQVQAALEGAYNGAAEVEVEAGLTYDQIMQNTRIYYYVRGGDAGLALAPIGVGETQDDMYNAIRDFLATPEAAEFSATSPGVPIAYTLKYLATRQVAQLSYSVIFDRRDCIDVTANQPQFQIVMTNIDDDAEVYLNGGFIGQYSETGTISLWEATGWSVGQTNTAEVLLKNGGCFATGINITVYRNGSYVWSDNFYRSIDHCGTTRHYTFTLEANGGFTPDY